MRNRVRRARKKWQLVHGHFATWNSFQQVPIVALRHPHEQAHAAALPSCRAGRTQLRRRPGRVDASHLVLGCAWQLQQRQRIPAVQWHALAAQKCGEAQRLRGRGAGQGCASAQASGCQGRPRWHARFHASAAGICRHRGVRAGATARAWARCAAPCPAAAPPRRRQARPRPAQRGPPRQAMHRHRTPPVTAAQCVQSSRAGAPPSRRRRA